MEFKLSNLMHYVLVSVRGNAGEFYVHIQLIHSFFKKIFGVEHIRFTGMKDELILKEGKHPFMYELAKLVHDRIKNELQMSSGPSLRAV